MESGRGEHYLGTVPLLCLDLCADQLVGWLYGLRVWFVVTRDHVVQLEAKGHQPAVHICRRVKTVDEDLDKT